MSQFLVSDEGSMHLELCAGEATGWDEVVKASSKLAQESLQSTAPPEKRQAYQPSMF